MVFVVIHTLRPTLKGLDHSHFACLCLLASMLYACVNLSCSRLCHVWCPPRAWSCLLTLDTHEALFGCNHLGGISGCQVALCTPFPFFCSVRRYAYHACLHLILAFFASLHAYLHVHAWVLLASVSSMLQHNEVMDIWSKPTFFSRRHHLLFPFLLFGLLACLLASLLLSLRCMLCLFDLCLFIYPLHSFLPSLFCWFLVFAFACTHTKRGRTELAHCLLSASKKGEDVSI